MEAKAIIGKQFTKEVIQIIENAKKSIRIVVFDWRWYPNNKQNPVQKFNQAIIQARRRGVEIKVITNMNDVIKILKTEGCEARKPLTPRLIHAKLMIVDDRIVINGSHNYTQSAFTMNHEVSTMIEDEQLAKSYIEFFNNLDQNYG
jgi:phosphatidylserine/phosphatidylglycerophosphate/cardiolipin synthase-like enzyme